MLTATDAALEIFAEKGYDPRNGRAPAAARDPDRNRRPASDELLAEKFKDGDSIWVDVDSEGGFVLTASPEETQPEEEPLGSRL